MSVNLRESFLECDTEWVRREWDRRKSSIYAIIKDCLKPQFRLTVIQPVRKMITIDGNLMPQYHVVCEYWANNFFSAKVAYELEPLIMCLDNDHEVSENAKRHILWRAKYPDAGFKTDNWDQARSQWKFTPDSQKEEGGFYGFFN